VSGYEHSNFDAISVLSAALSAENVRKRTLKVLQGGLQQLPFLLFLSLPGVFLPPGGPFKLVKKWCKHSKTLKKYTHADAPT